MTCFHALNFTKVVVDTISLFLKCFAASVDSDMELLKLHRDKKTVTKRQKQYQSSWTWHFWVLMETWEETFQLLSHRSGLDLHHILLSQTGLQREKKRFLLLKSNSTCALIKSQLKHDGRPDLACWGPTHQPCPQLWPPRRQRFCSPCRWTHRACWCPVWFYWTVTWSACTYSHWENSWGLPGPGLCPRWWWECWGTACDGGWARTSWWWREEEGRRTCGWHAVTWAALRREVCCSGRWQRKAPKSCRNR